MGHTTSFEEQHTMSPSVSLSFALLLPLLMSMCSASPFNNFLVSTVSETTTVTTTSTSTFVCAELINATTACNARNGRWLHVPEILTFDESIDIVDHYINPSVPYSWKRTRVPTLIRLFRPFTMRLYRGCR